MTKTKRFSLGRLALTASATAILILANWVAKATPLRVAEASEALGAQPAGLIFEYKMPAGQILRYQYKTETRRVSEAMGEVTELLTTSTGACSFKAKGRRDQNHLLGVTIDDMSMTITGPRGDLSPDLKSVRGKSFDMVLSPLGSEVDVSGAESITYEFMTETRNVASGFRSFFPDLPGKAIEVGDSWPSSDVINENTETTKLRMDLQYINTVNGFETVDGMKCARITSKITGKISGSGPDWILEGTHKGTDVWYFAPKEGIYVQSTSDSVSEMTISVSGERAMTIPGTTTHRSEIRLTGR